MWRKSADSATASYSSATVCLCIGRSCKPCWGDAATFAQPHQAFLRPASVAYLASLETETVDYLTLMPLYLRAPNAALNKKLTEGLHA